MLFGQLSDANPGGPLGCLGTVHKSGAAVGVIFESVKPLLDVCIFPAGLKK